MSQFKRHMNEIIGVHLEDSGGVALLRWTVAAEYGTPQTLLLVAAVGYRAIVESMNGSWLPETIHLPLPKPDNLRTFLRVFAPPIEFNSDISGFSFPAADLDRPNPSADEHMANHAASLLRMAPKPPESIVDRIRHALVLLLPVGRGSLEYVASNLGLQPRTLQRELKGHGLTFAQLLDETRRDLARAHLAIPGRTASEVGALIGYSSASSFSRWFTDQFGVSPSRWQGRKNDP